MMTDSSYGIGGVSAKRFGMGMQKMQDRKSGKDGMLLHYVLFGGKIAYSFKITPHSIIY